MLLSYDTIIKFSLRKLSVIFCASSKTQPLNAISVSQPGGRWFKSRYLESSRELPLRLDNHF